MEWLTRSPVPKFTRLAFYRTYFGKLAAFPSINPSTPILHFNIQSKWINSSSITSSVFPSEPSFLDCELSENRSCITHSKYLLPRSTSIIVLGTHGCVVNVGRMTEILGACSAHYICFISPIKTAAEYPLIWFSLVRKWLVSVDSGAQHRNLWQVSSEWLRAPFPFVSGAHGALYVVGHTLRRLRVFILWHYKHKIGKM